MKVVFHIIKYTVTDKGTGTVFFKIKVPILMSMNVTFSQWTRNNYTILLPNLKLQSHQRLIIFATNRRRNKPETPL